MNQKQIWEILQERLNKPLDQDALKNIAKGVSPSDQDNEEKMRQLVRTLSTLAGIPLTPQKEEDILKFLRENKFTGMESFNKILKK